MTENDLAIKVAELEGRCEQTFLRLERVEQRQDTLEKLATSVEVLATKQDKTDGDIQEIKKDVKYILAKPAKKWDSAMDKILLTVVSALAAALLIKLGLIF